jgi:hypothetical protein
MPALFNRIGAQWKSDGASVVVSVVDVPNPDSMLSELLSNRLREVAELVASARHFL